MGFSHSQPRRESQSAQWKDWRDWSKQGRERIDIIVDSGASTSMLPKDVARDHPIRPGTNRSYTTASKQEVRVEGEKELVCGFMNGTEMKTTWEVGEINRPLSSVSKMVRGGHRIWFDTEERGGSGCYSYSTGKTLRLYERDGIYVLPAWIRSGISTSNPAPGTAGFGRQGQNP